MSKITLDKNDEGRYHLSQSSIKNFKRCRLKFYLSSSNELNLRPKREQKNLWVGMGLHKSLELYYSDDIDPVEVWLEWCDFEEQWIKNHSRKFGEDEDTIQEQRELGKGMLEYYKKQDDDKKIQTKNNEFEVIDTEVSFSVPIPSHNGNQSMCDFVGRADGIVKDKYGRLFGLENKGWANNSIDHLEMDQQASLYTWGLTQEYGEKFEGMLYNILLKKLPSYPDINKGGTVSRRKKKTLTVENYKEKLEQQGEDAEDYQDTLNWISENSYEFVKRHIERRNQGQLDYIQNHLYTVYRDIQGSKIYPEPEKKFGSMCGDCSFKDPCRLIQEGRNPQTTLDRKFEEANIHSKEEEFEEYLREGTDLFQEDV